MDLFEVEAQVRTCTRCPLSVGRTNAVPGAGSASAEVMFIGEGPGKSEDLQGKPFVGAAGRILNELLASIGFSREDIYIANVVKCRPPDNRDPLPEEVVACWPYLEAQISAIKPLLIVTLGRHSMNRFLPNLKISEAHGRAKSAKGLWAKTQVYLPLYHPAVALYSPSKKSVLLEDFAQIPLILDKLRNQ